jgi:Cu/Ag efflux pump CusA
MLNALIRFSLAQRGLIVTLALVLLVLGGRKLTQLPVEVLPDLTKPTVTILTEAPGFAPEEVETLVSVPLENALMGVNGVSRLRTVNDISLSLIFVEFDWGTDIYQARQFVQERLTGVTETLPWPHLWGKSSSSESWTRPARPHPVNFEPLPTGHLPGDSSPSPAWQRSFPWVVE